MTPFEVVYGRNHQLSFNSYLERQWWQLFHRLWGTEMYFYDNSSIFLSELNNI